VNMTRIKMCGVTRLDDARMCVQAGADLIGLNFYPKSPRYLSPDAARQITNGLRRESGACPLLVGVLVNASAEEIARIMEIAGLDAAQLSGDESGVLAALAGRGIAAIQALRPRSPDEARGAAVACLPHATDDERLPSLLVDAYHPDLYGGTGEVASLAVAVAVKEVAPRMMLAGGLTPDNVADRVRAVRPWG